MPVIELEDKELHEIMESIANTWTWAKANPLLVKISNQIKEQLPEQPQQQMRRYTVTGRVNGDGVIEDPTVESEPINDTVMGSDFANRN
jgi:hypothetical protein